MLGFYNYTVILTYIGMLTSFWGIVFSFRGNIYAALICLMMSSCCDMFDGRIASTMERTRREKDFGIQIDSMSDLICFGVLPATILLRTCAMKDFSVFVAGAYLLAALIRLSFFNVDEAERQMQSDDSRTIYQGLPVTTIALLLPLMFIGSLIPGYPLKTMLIVGMMLTAIAFLSPFQLKKPGAKGKLIMVVVGLAELFAVIVYLKGRV